MSLECLRTDSLLTAALAGQASAADRLRLEAHLETCAACRERQAACEALRRLQRWEPPALSDVARERVRRAVLARSPGSAAPARRRVGWRAAIATACVVVVVALAAAPWRGAHRPAPPSAAAPAPTRAQAITLAPGPDGAVRLDDILVVLDPGTEALWHAAARTVELRRGGVLVDVPHGRGRGFRVQTAHFIAQVAGTRFRVDRGGVATQRGLVWVLGPDGRLLAEVAAGQEWRRPAPASQPVPAAAAASQPPAGAPAPGSSARAATGAATHTAAERLAQARHELAAGRTARARALLRPLLDGPRQVAAEAGSLMAESYLVAHDLAEAIRRYRVVARDCDGTPQAESALYAVGQLEGERGDREASARALRRYLARYPKGRFVAEARARLVQLDGPRR
jgi:ferric-dicitrate binding protein FerR (iron transport regulator)